ncbi:MAG: hypothetical protein ABFC84_09125 [Veillonellales bacterium]
MKDMSVEELEHGMKLVINSDAVDLIGKMAITNCWNELLRRFEDSKCCGNCKAESQSCYAVKGTIIIKHPKSHYCDKYEYDGLSREEREGK